MPTRRAALTGTGLLAAATLLGTPAAQAYNQAAPASPRQLSHGALLHDARFATHGFSRYKNLHPAGLVIGRDLGITRDPAGGREPVAYFDSHAGLTHGNAHPRASVESPAQTFATAHGNTQSTYVHHARIYIPRSSAMSTTSHWSALFSTHGAPWGSSRCGLMLVFNPKTRNHYLRMGNDPSLLKERDTVIPLNRWVGMAVAFNYNYASHGGWLRMALNTTGNTKVGWRSVPIKGVTGPLSENVISSQEGDGWFRDKGVPAATPRIGTYGNHPMRLYARDHRLARDPWTALGPQWDGKLDGRKFVG